LKNRKFLTTKTEFINFLVNDDTVVKIVGRPVTLIVEVVGSHLILRCADVNSSRTFFIPTSI